MKNYFLKIATINDPKIIKKMLATTSILLP